jgi:hypothetical protein
MYSCRWLLIHSSTPPVALTVPGISQGPADQVRPALTLDGLKESHGFGKAGRQGGARGSTQQESHVILFVLHADPELFRLERMICCVIDVVFLESWIPQESRHPEMDGACPVRGNKSIRH